MHDVSVLRVRVLRELDEARRVVDPDPCRAGRKAEVAVDQIRAISKDRLVKRLDRLKPPLDAELRSLIVEMYGS